MNVPRDLIPVRKWLQEKELLKESPTPEEEKKSINWIKRHMAVQLYSMKAGYTQVSRSEMDHAYAVFQTKFNVVHANKERAALKLNAKVNAAKMFKKKYDLTTPSARKTFYESPEGRNAINFFFAAFIKEKSHAMLPNEVWEFVQPTQELKALLETNKNNIKLSAEIWALVHGINTSAPAELSLILPVSTNIDNLILTANAQQKRARQDKKPDRRTKEWKEEQKRIRDAAAAAELAAAQAAQQQDPVGGQQEQAPSGPTNQQSPSPNTETDPPENADQPRGGRGR